MLSLAHQIAVALAGIYLVAVVYSWQAIKYVLKPTVTLLIAYPTFNRPYSKISAGLLCSTLGDIFLMAPSQSMFIPGLLSFLAAHVLYIASFEAPLRLSWTAAPLAAFAASMACILWPGVTKEGIEVQLGVVVYILAITTMAFKATLTNVPMLVCGTLLFCISDAVLAYAKFIRLFAWSEFVVMLTYYMAQLCIAIVHS
ncbi:hypothetical protein IWW36_001051 [Coemansia brasiliensis]|uniref:YhhN-like protein n=1 Tax=Coemansia brasiliensis TaxID=2650707 RepID=A0A9W8IAC2_9FUNG|nr:hypothetical protein IWW36_001051 [Coemansia brasiliensis]